MEARSAVLGRIRAALEATDREAPPEPAPAAPPSVPRVDVVDLFANRVRGYRAEVVVADDVSAAIEAVLERQGARRVGICADLPVELRPAGVELVVDTGLAPGELDALDGALTTCAGACAETGTIALDGGPGQGRRALTLVPDLHVCVVSRAVIVATFSELLGQLAASVAAGRPLVLVSGPSATSDIGLERVEGVHGPRRLVVILAP
jgi:L-lactate dehydrogenase complex protein LldG